MWLVTGILHIVYAWTFREYIDTCYNSCDSLKSGATEQEKALHLADCYQKRYSLGCPEAKCPFKRLEGQTEEQYAKWCLAYPNVKKREEPKPKPFIMNPDETQQKVSCGEGDDCGDDWSFEF